MVNAPPPAATNDKPGPRKKPKSLRRKKAVKVYLRASEYDELSGAAIAHGKDVSAWARELLLEYARR